MAILAAALLLSDLLLARAMDFLYGCSGASPLAVVRAEKPDAVVVGTSTAKSAVHPAHWPGKLVNFGQDGQTVFYSVAMARILAAEESIKTMVIVLDPYDLKAGLTNPAAKRVWRIAPLLAVTPDLAPLLRQTRDFSEAPFFLTSWRFRGEFSKIMNQLGNTRPEPYRPLPAGALVEPRPKLAAPTPDDKVHASLEPYLAVLKILAATGEKTIVLTIAPIYSDRYSSAPATAALLDDLRGHLAGSRICDLMEADTPALAAVRANRLNFNDKVHLTEAGAKAFTPELSRLIAERCRN